MTDWEIVESEKLSHYTFKCPDCGAEYLQPPDSMMFGSQLDCPACENEVDKGLSYRSIVVLVILCSLLLVFALGAVYLGSTFAGTVGAILAVVIWVTTTIVAIRTTTAIV